MPTRTADPQNGAAAVPFKAFRCGLSKAKLVRMKMAVNELIDHDMGPILYFQSEPMDGIYAFQMIASRVVCIPADGTFPFFFKSFFP